MLEFLPEVFRQKMAAWLEVHRIFGRNDGPGVDAGTGIELARRFDKFPNGTVLIAIRVGESVDPVAEKLLQGIPALVDFPQRLVRRDSRQVRMVERVVGGQKA